MYLSHLSTPHLKDTYKCILAHISHITICDKKCDKEILTYDSILVYNSVTAITIYSKKVIKILYIVIFKEDSNEKHL